MGDNIAVPVVAGLAVGIAFVTTFALIMMPSQSFSFSPYSTDKVDGRIIASANNLEEAQVFFSQYPNGEVRVDRTGNEIEGSAVRYGYQKVYKDGKVNEVRMFVMIDDRTDKPTNEIFLDCAVWYVNGFGGMTYSGGYSIVEELKTTECAK